jgi:hypothetical protein
MPDWINIQCEKEKGLWPMCQHHVIGKGGDAVRKILDWLAKGRTEVLAQKAAEQSAVSWWYSKRIMSSLEEARLAGCPWIAFPF